VLLKKLHLLVKKPGSFEPGLFQDAVYSSNWQILFRVWHRYKARLRRVFEVVVATDDTRLSPAIIFQHPDQLL
jgi:hypothetical protein